ncbi:MAG: hypothetical protein Q4G11_05185, partial [Gallicola sp.]|nr:hypothetical protein [Gallicola sp.]
MNYIFVSNQKRQNYNLCYSTNMRLSKFINKSSLAFVWTRRWTRIKKRILGQKLYSPEQKALFDRIKIGQVVYAEMPLADKSLFDIPEGHRCRPYIVTGKTASSLFCHAGSHKKSNYLTNKNTFKLHRSLNTTHYRQGKERNSKNDSYYDLSEVKELPIEKLLYFFQQPFESDLMQLERQLTVLKNEEKNVYLLRLSFPLREGDCLDINGQKSIIYSVYKSDIYAHPYSDKEDSKCLS